MQSKHINKLRFTWKNKEIKKVHLGILLSVLEFVIFKVDQYIINALRALLTA